MKKQYEKIALNIWVVKEDIVRTSAVDDPFNDGYQDPNIQLEQ